jgi:hypothetical protein
VGGIDDDRAGRLVAYIGDHLAAERGRFLSAVWRLALLSGRLHHFGQKRAEAIDWHVGEGLSKGGNVEEERKGCAKNRGAGAP